MTDPILDLPAVCFEPTGLPIATAEESPLAIAEEHVADTPSPPQPETTEVSAEDYDGLHPAQAAAKTKKQLIADIQACQRLAGVSVQSDVELGRSNKTQLAQRLADLLAKSVDDAQRKPAAAYFASQSAAPASPADVSNCALMLFKMNCYAADVLQLANNEANPYVEMRGMVDRLEADRDLLIAAYAEIYVKHQQQLAVIMDPAVRILFINTSAAVSACRLRPDHA